MLHVVDETDLLTRRRLAMSTRNNGYCIAVTSYKQHKAAILVSFLFFSILLQEMHPSFQGTYSGL